MNQKLVIWTIRCCLLYASPHLLSAQRLTRHPTPENLVLPGQTIRVSKKDSITTSAALGTLARQLRQATRTDSMGTISGPIETVFGMIRDVSIAPNGNVLINDMANSIIRGFDGRGTFLFTIGRPGSGPEDLRGPISAWGTSRGEVVVYDIELGVKRFQQNDKKIFKLKNSIRPPSGLATAACASQGKLYVFAADIVYPREAPKKPDANSANIVSVYDSTGKLITAFGSPYNSPIAIVKRVMSEGDVGCAQDGTVVSTLSNLPYLRAYDDSGKSKWNLQFTDFVVGRFMHGVTSTGQNHIGLDDDDPRHSYVLKVREISPGFMTAQVGTMTRESLKDHSIWATIDTYLVETSSGKAVFISSKLPILSGVVRDRLFGYANDPYPRVIAMTLR